ncbi:fungal-specific transcription factor domain-containing protein [Aspergillus germanicus]
MRKMKPDLSDVEVPRPRSTRQSAQPRIRAGKACNRCHDKRVKCDAMHRLPCTHCARDGNVDCVLRETKRGTYIRKHRQENSTRATCSGRSKASTSSDVELESGDIARAPLHAPDTAASIQTANTIPTSIAGVLSNTEALGYAQLVNGGRTEQASSHLSVTASDTPPERTSPTEPEDSPSYRDISWSAMFDHFLDNRENRKDFIDKCSITYLGESFPLAIVLGDLPKLHHIGPPLPRAQAHVPSQSQPAHMPPEDLEYLKSKGVFELPEKSSLDTIMSVFVDRVYPLYPIVNRQELLQQHSNGEIPLILLYAISFIAVTFCAEPDLRRIGFESRIDARSFFYKKTKALFDMGYETNKITLLQSTLLLSFWGGGPNTYWNFYSWISTAVTVAEAIGIHRSTAAVMNMQPHDKSLMRRLWWILVVRDSICGALVGRPFRIDMDQADTDMLTIEDFVHDAPEDFLSSPSSQQYARYQIETAKMSLIMREIITSRFHPGNEPVESTVFHARLDQWKSELSPTLTWDDEVPDASNPFSLSLSVQYNHHLILNSLGPLRGSNTLYHLDEQAREEIVDSAAENISTVLTTLVTKSSLLTVPHELFHGMFLAQAAFYTRTKSPNKLVARLGRSALNNCQMVLRVVSEFWDPSPFIMQLFENLSARSPEKQFAQALEATGNRGLAGVEGAGLSDAASAANESGVFNALLGDDRWQSNSMLSSLFDLPPELFLPE